MSIQVQVLFKGKQSDKVQDKEDGTLLVSFINLLELHFRLVNFHKCKNSINYPQTGNSSFFAWNNSLL